MPAGVQARATGTRQITGAPNLFFIKTTIVRNKIGKSDNLWLNASPTVFLAKASRGEERTFALLKKLPDDNLIYYEPNIDNRHPDYVVGDSFFDVHWDSKQFENPRRPVGSSQGCIFAEIQHPQICLGGYSSHSPHWLSGVVYHATCVCISGSLNLMENGFLLQSTGHGHTLITTAGFSASEAWKK